MEKLFQRKINEFVNNIEYFYGLID